MIDTLSTSCQFENFAKALNDRKYKNNSDLCIKICAGNIYNFYETSSNKISWNTCKELNYEKNRTLNLQTYILGALNVKQLLSEISSRGQLIATDRFAIILHLYRNRPMNMNEIKDELPGSTEILREYEKPRVVRREIDSTKYP